MKKKTLIIGILLGAVIASGCFLLFQKNNSNGRDFGGRPDMDQNMMGERGGPMGNDIQEPPMDGFTEDTTSET